MVVFLRAFPSGKRDFFPSFPCGGVALFSIKKLGTQYPVPSTQYPVPSTQYPVPSIQYQGKGPREGSKTAVACDTMSCEGGIPACAAGARYATFIVSAYPFFSLSVGFYELRPSNGECKIRIYANCPTFILYFSFRSQVLTIFCTQTWKWPVKTDTCILGQKYSVLSAK